MICEHIQAIWQNDHNKFVFELQTEQINIVGIFTYIYHAWNVRKHMWKTEDM